MTTITTIGLDIAKSSFAVHCTDATGKAMKKVQLKRSQVLPFFAERARARSRECGDSYSNSEFDLLELYPSVGTTAKR
jgi:transposase